MGIGRNVLGLILVLILVLPTSFAPASGPDRRPVQPKTVVRADVWSEISRGMERIVKGQLQGEPDRKDVDYVWERLNQIGKERASHELEVAEAWLEVTYFYCRLELNGGRLPSAESWAKIAVQEGTAFPYHNHKRMRAIVQMAFVRDRITNQGRRTSPKPALDFGNVSAVVEKQGRGELKLAADLASKLYDQSTRDLGQGSPDFIRAILLLADLHSETAMLAGQPKIAVDRAQEARTIAERHLPAGDPARVQALLRGGELQFLLKAPELALPLLDQTAAEAKLNPQENARALLSALVLAAAVRLGRGEEPAPTTLAAIAKAVQGLPPGDPHALEPQLFFVYHAWIKRQVAAQRLIWKLEPVDSVERGLQEEFKRIEEAFQAAGVDRDLASLGHLELARFQWKNQRLKSPEATLEPLAAAFESPRIAPWQKADYWNLRGLVESSRAQYAQARLFHEKARKIQEAAKLPQVAESLNNLGDLLLRQGDYRAAREQLQRAAELFAQDPGIKTSQARVFTLTNLGKALEGESRYSEAEQLHRRALGLAEETGEKDAEALCRNNLAINLYTAGKFEDARTEFLAVRDLVTKIFGESHPRAAEVDVNLGWVALAFDRTDEAEAQFRKALSIIRLELGNDHPRTAEILSYLARVLAGKDRNEEARKLLAEAMNLREHYLDLTLHSALSERDQLAIVQELRVHPESSAWPGVLDTYLDLGPRIGIPSDELYQRLLNWKGVIARFAATRDRAKPSPATLPLLRRRDELLSKLRNAALIKPARNQRKKHEEDLAAWESEVDEVERLIRRQDGTSQNPSLTNTTPVQIQSILAPRSALLDVIEIRPYQPRTTGVAFTQDRRYVAFLASHDRPLTAITLGDARVVDESVTAFLGALAAGDVDASASSGKLASLVRDPLVPHLEGIELLIVAGDGLLGRLPLGALAGSRPGSYWIEELAFAAVPMAQSLVARRLRPPSTAKGLIAVGGVDYGASTGGTRRAVNWAPLGATEAEAKDVVRLFRKTHPNERADVVSGKDAEEAKLRQELPRSRYAHLATHGFFRRGSEADEAYGIRGVTASLASGIVLAGANRVVAGDPNDHLLTSEEVASMDLSAQDLIVLSACDTGLGHITAGQGTIGLFGALDRAGTGAVVSALWKVEDRATTLLMAAFYKELWSNREPIGPAKALQAAQRMMIRLPKSPSSEVSYAHPRFWAAFVVGGNPY